MILEIVEGIIRPMSHLNSSTAWGDKYLNLIIQRLLECSTVPCKLPYRNKLSPQKASYLAIRCDLSCAVLVHLALDVSVQFSCCCCAVRSMRRAKSASGVPDAVPVPYRRPAPTLHEMHNLHYRVLLEYFSFGTYRILTHEQIDYRHRSDAVNQEDIL